MAQTLLPTEIVVSENGDDPETAEVIARLSREGAPIRYNRNVPPLAQGGNRRRAIELTTGDFVAMLDDDDEWEPEFLAKAHAALVAHPECGFAMGDHWVIDERGEVLPAESEAASRRFGRDRLTTGTYDDVLLRHLESKTMTLATSLFRRSVLEAIDFMPVLPDIGPDFALFVELGARRVRVRYLAERLGRYRVHPGQATAEANRIAFGEGTLYTLRRLAPRYELHPAERAQLATLFRSTTVELAIACAHRHKRRAALRAVRTYGEFGWGLPSLWRVTVLGALLLGWRHRRGGRAAHPVFARRRVHPR